LFKVLWTFEALDRLTAIGDFIAQDNPNRARKFVINLIERGESLSKYPKRGRAVPEIPNPRLREIIVNNYRIIYRLHRDRIEIITVFEGHRQYRMNEIKE
jgi:toxin ParE1/3/4